MSSKKKLVISLSVAAAVLVAAIIAIVAVFAAAQQSVQSAVKVTFRAKNVDCTVAGVYQTNTQSEKTAFETFNILAKDTNVNEDQTAKVYPANLPDVDLQQGTGDKADEVWLKITYTITNNADRAMLVKLDKFTTNQYFTIAYDPEMVTTDGVEIAAHDSADFVITITATQAALQSATDVEMDVTLDWTLTAVTYVAPTT